jgi:hypothetical protein
MVPAVACVQVSRAIDDVRRQRSTKDILDFLKILSSVPRQTATREITVSFSEGSESYLHPLRL